MCNAFCELCTEFRTFHPDRLVSFVRVRVDKQYKPTHILTHSVRVLFVAVFFQMKRTQATERMLCSIPACT